jgi:hypothetical protein
VLAVESMGSVSIVAVFFSFIRLPNTFAIANISYLGGSHHVYCNYRHSPHVSR